MISYFTLNVQFSVQQRQIEKHREATEAERIRLLDLVKSLETKLTMLTQVNLL